MRKALSRAIVGLAVVAALYGNSPQAQATPQTFFGEDLGLGEITRLPTRPNADAARDAFLGQLSGFDTEEFEGFSVGAVLPLYPSFSGVGVAELTGQGVIRNVPTGTDGSGRYPISGDQYLRTSSSAFSIEFPVPIMAFGFYGIDLGDFNGQISVEISSNTTTQLTIPHTVNSPGGSVVYFGIIDTANPFTTVSFFNSGAQADIFAFDDLTVGSLAQVNEMPEPGTLGLLATGLLGLLGYGRRRRQQHTV